MYLKRLEVLGFKSFALRTFLDFSPGITAVVGPNGSGKSNVADSMRWVLGEQSMRQLRGKKSDDIIFVGGHGKAPLGMAEVSLTLDNSSGWVPSDYSEITITRRSYRSGENEYLINRQKVRLKDIILLLAQARIGADSYTVVGQGLIDQALSLRAEERRALFEDAAGIRPFQVQKTDAENRLKQTEINLERLRDIISEIEPRLQPLSEQARRAAEHTQLNTELQEVLLSWYALQWRRFQAQRDQTVRKEQVQALQVDQQEKAVQQMNERANLLRGQRQQLQERIEAARQQYSKASGEAQQIERDLAVSEERLTGLVRQRQSQQQVERQLRESLISTQQRAIDLEEQCDQADESVDQISVRLAEQEQQIGRLQKEYEMDERRLRATQNDLIQVQARLGASQTDWGRQQKHLGERNRALASRREAISQSKQVLQTLEARLVEQSQQLETVKREEHQLLQKKQNLQARISGSQQEIENRKAELQEEERQRRRVADRLQMLKSWRQNLSGYNDGVRGLLRAPEGKIAGIVGPVPQLGIVEPGWERALEAALGTRLQAVVVERFEDAQSGLEYLESMGAGKAIIIWLQGVEEGTLQNEEERLQRLGAIHPIIQEPLYFASHYMQCEERLRPLFQRLLRGIVIVESLEGAGRILERSARHDRLLIERAVTIAGQVMHREGWFSGGNSKEVLQQGFLVYERELQELPKQLEKYITGIENLNQQIGESGRIQEERKRDLSRIEKDLQRLGAQLNELHRSVNNIQREQERAQTEFRLASSVEQQLINEIQGLEQEVEVVQERVANHEKKQRELEGLVESLQLDVEERGATYRRQQEELGKSRTAVALKRQEARTLRQQLQGLQSQVGELRSGVDRQKARMQEFEQQRSGLELVISQRKRELEQIRAQVKVYGENVQQAEGQVGDVEQRIIEVDQRTQQLHKRMAELEVNYRKCLLESQKARDALETLLSQLQEEMGIVDPQELVVYIPLKEERDNKGDQVDLGFLTEAAQELTEAEEQDLKKLRRRVEGLRSRLKLLGGYDPDAPQQYEEARTRYAFMSSQVADMEQATSQLQLIIAQLDASMAQQFEQTFQAVNARFREHFITLFNGGSARLELIAARASEEEQDRKVADHKEKTELMSSMPSGVEVIVQPPGKKVQDLSLLSGGERALISAALLFALLEINPPPFCLLDEVDAALDESNVTRFCEILKKLSQRTQFIVITHNRVTMTAAQAVYGVSMGGDSISRLLSIRFEDTMPRATQLSLPTSGKLE